MKKYKNKLILLLTIFFLLIPLGLLTDYPAWGEWDLSYYREVLGYIPKNMTNTISIPSIIPDYSLEGLHPVLSYYISAIVGVSIIFFTFWGLKNMKK